MSSPMMLCLEMRSTREDSSLSSVMISVLSMALVGLLLEMIVVQVLPLNESTYSRLYFLNAI